MKAGNTAAAGYARGWEGGRFRHFALASFIGKRAARGIRTARGALRRRRGGQGEGLGQGRDRRVATGRIRQPGTRRGEESAVGVGRAGQQFAGRGVLHQPPAVDHEQPIAHPGEQAEIMADQPQRRAVLFVQLVHLGQQPGAGQTVERGARFIENR